MGTFGLHELILCVSEGVPSELLCIHIVGMGTFGLHELILCVAEGFLSELLCIHIVDIGTSFDLHGLILCVSEVCIYSMFCIHIDNIHDFYAPFLKKRQNVNDVTNLCEQFRCIT